MGVFNPPSSLTNSPLWQAYQYLDRSQWLSAAEIEKQQLARLAPLIEHCYAHVPYYRQLMDEMGLQPRAIQSMSDFRRFPRLTRALCQTNSAKLVATQLPEGIKAQAKSIFTSGTNGVPIEVRKTNYENWWWQALYLRDLEWSGFDPSGRLAVIRFIAMTEQERPAAMKGRASTFWKKFCHELTPNGPSFGMDIHQLPPIQLEWLRRVRPNYLQSMPSNLEFLAGLIQESGQRLDGLRAIQAIGESLDETTQQRIEAGFGVAVNNLYSTTETGYIASTCPTGQGLHVHSESVIAEVLDVNDQPCVPGATGRLVLTSLNGYHAPFIRYEILDEVTLADGPCKCGRGLPLWKRVDGRRFPLFLCPDGQRRNSVRVTREMRLIGGVHQFQVVQRKVDHIVVRVVPNRSWTVDHIEKIRTAVREQFGTEIRVDIEEKQYLERPPGGKLLIVVSELEQR